MSEVQEFIQRRFPTNCNWKSGNCYYFSQILLSRFPEGILCYDVIDGHFCVKIDEVYYDWCGIYIPTAPIEWDKFDEYDNIQKQVVIRDCIM